MNLKNTVELILQEIGIWNEWLAKHLHKETRKLKMKIQKHLDNTLQKQ